MQTDKGLVLAAQALETLRQRQIILPALTVVERACAEAVTRANRRIYRTLTEPLTAQHRRRLDDLLKIKPESNITKLVWLRQSPLKPNSRHMLEHIERLKAFQELSLPEGIGRHIHQNRLLKMAREGGQMTPQDLAKFESERRYATLVALALEGTATVTDEVVDLHDRILVKLFSTAKNKHQQQFQKQGKAINDKVPAPERFGGCAARTGADRAHAVYPGLAAKCRVAPPCPCRVEQGRSAERAGPGRVLQPVGRNPRPQFRAAALSRQRPQSGDSRHRFVEHRLSRPCHAGAARHRQTHQ